MRICFEFTELSQVRMAGLPQGGDFSLPRQSTPTPPVSSRDELPNPPRAATAESGWTDLRTAGDVCVQEYGRKITVATEAEKRATLKMSFCVTHPFALHLPLDPDPAFNHVVRMHEADRVNHECDVIETLD